MPTTPQQILAAQIQAKQSFLCIGLDPDISQLPPHLLRNHPPHEAVRLFCESIIQATHTTAVAYKLNLAFFECLGTAGAHVLAAVRAAIPPDVARWISYWV